MKKPHTSFLPFLLLCMVLGASFLLIKPLTSKRTSRESRKKTMRPPDEYFLSRNYPYIGDGEAAYTRAVYRYMKSLKTRNQNTPWTMEGPYNTGGRITSIAIDKNNTNTIYIGTPAAGIFKTTDGGNTWVHQFTQEPTTAIGVLAIDPQNSNTIYAGTGDGALSSFTYLGRGLYKSTDGGATWDSIGLGNTGVINKIAIHPTNPDIMYAGTMGNIYTQDMNRGLYKSTDGGNTWNQVLYINPTAGIGDLCMDLSHPDTLLVSGRNRFRSNLLSVVTGPDTRIFRTHNGGLSWDTLSNGLPPSTQCKINLAMSQNNPSLIYASYCDTTLEYAGLYKTTNGGNSWSFVSQDPSLNMGGFGWYSGEIRLDPNNSNKIYWMGVDLFVSNNGGNSWTMNAPPWYTYDVHADKHDLQFINSSTYFLATDGGLYKTTVGGGTDSIDWMYKSQLPLTQFYRVAYNPWDSLRYFGGAQDNGSNKGSQNFGLSNWMRYLGGDGFQPAFDKNNPMVSYAEIQNGDIRCSVTGGNSYYNISQSVSSGDRCNWNTPYVVSPHTVETMYMGSYKVYKNITSTTDNWIDISPDLTDGTNDKYHVISALDISTLNAQLLYAGTGDGNVWVTQNDGGNWTPINSGLPDRYVSCVKASPSVLSGVFLSYWGYRDNDTTSYIYYSSNYGSNWTLISNGSLPNFAINDIWVLNDGTDSSLVIANDGGVYATTNRGGSWVRVGNNMPLLPVYDVEYNPATKRIFAGTFAMSMQSIHIDSIFKPKDPVLPNALAPIAPGNFPVIFPNPCFRQFSMEPGSPLPYTLTVRNTSGLIVIQTKELKEKQLIDCSSMPPGLYFVEMRSGSATHVLRLLKE